MRALNLRRYLYICSVSLLFTSASVSAQLGFPSTSTKTMASQTDSPSLSPTVSSESPSTIKPSDSAQPTSSSGPISSDGFQCPSVRPASSDDKIFLTFTNGPRGSTRKMELDVLESVGIKANFFEAGGAVCNDITDKYCENAAGAWRNRSKEVVNTIAAGHFVGSYGHNHFIDKSGRCNLVATDTSSRIPECSDSSSLQNMWNGAYDLALAIEAYGDDLGSYKSKAVENVWSQMSIPCANEFRIPDFKGHGANQAPKGQEAAAEQLANSLSKADGGCKGSARASSVNVYGYSGRASFLDSDLDVENGYCDVAEKLTSAFDDTESPTFQQSRVVARFEAGFSGLLTNPVRSKNLRAVAIILKAAGYKFETLDALSGTGSKCSSCTPPKFECKVPKSEDEETIYLTIEEGPTTLRPSLLSALDELEIKATFYDSGSNVCDDERDPNCRYALGYKSMMKNVIRAVSSGHFVASHSFNNYVVPSGAGTHYLYSAPINKVPNCPSQERVENMVTGAYYLEQAVLKYGDKLKSFKEKAIDNFWLYSRLPATPFWRTPKYTDNTTSGIPSEDIPVRLSISDTMYAGNVPCRPQIYASRPWEIHGFDYNAMLVKGDLQPSSACDAARNTALILQGAKSTRTRTGKVVVAVKEYYMDDDGILGLKAYVSALKDQGYRFKTMDTYFGGEDLTCSDCPNGLSLRWPDDSANDDTRDVYARLTNLHTLKIVGITAAGVLLISLLLGLFIRRSLPKGKKAKIFSEHDPKNPAFLHEPSVLIPAQPTVILGARPDVSQFSQGYQRGSPHLAPLTGPPVTLPALAEDMAYESPGVSRHTIPRGGESTSLEEQQNLLPRPQDSQPLPHTSRPPSLHGASSGASENTSGTMSAARAAHYARI